MNALTVGKPYPGQIADGVMFDAFARGGTLLRIGMPDITAREEKDYRQGAVKLRIERQGSVILCRWRFGTQPVCESPFEPLLAVEADNYVPGALDTRTERLVVRLHLVDTGSMKVRGLRTFTLTREQTAQLADCCIDILGGSA